MIQLMDTTLRDGEQTQGVAFSPAEKLGIARALLHSLHVDRIEIASARVSQGERIAVETILDWESQHDYLDRIEVLGFVDHQHSVDWIVQSGGRVLNLVLHATKPLPAETSSHQPHQVTDQLRSRVTYPTGVATNS